MLGTGYIAFLLSRVPYSSLTMIYCLHRFVLFCALQCVCCNDNSLVMIYCLHTAVPAFLCFRRSIALSYLWRRILHLWVLERHSFFASSPTGRVHRIVTFPRANAGPGLITATTSLLSFGCQPSFSDVTAGRDLLLAQVEAAKWHTKIQDLQSSQTASKVTRRGCGN